MCLHAYIFNLFRDRAMPRDDYVVRVSVDGVPIPDQSICKGVEKSVHCSFYVSGQHIQHRLKLVLCSKSLISFSLYLFSDSVVAHADYHGGDSSNWPPRYSALSLQHAVNVQSLVRTSYLNISFIILMQTPWWQCEDWSGLMCTEATRKGAPMASTSDFWGTEYIK